MKKSAYNDIFEDVFFAPHNKFMKEEQIHPLGAGGAGIKLILDSHTMTNRIDDYKKGLCYQILPIFY
jgi:hypothetical protein